jgi:hypothetical protein
MIKQILLFTLVVSISLQLKISHQQLSYRLGTNYDGGANAGTVSNCDKIPPPQEPIFYPVPVQPITITCTLPRVYSPNTKRCECLSETIFDPQTNQCLCPVQKPLWNGKQCVKCSDSMYFDQ